MKLAAWGQQLKTRLKRVEALVAGGEAVQGEGEQAHGGLTLILNGYPTGNQGLYTLKAGL